MATNKGETALTQTGPSQDLRGGLLRTSHALTFDCGLSIPQSWRLMQCTSTIWGAFSLTKKVVSRRLDLLSFLYFLSTRARRKKAEVFQGTLASRYKVSLRTTIRDLCWLRDAGYLTWEHVPAAHGGDKCRFLVTAAGAHLVDAPLFPDIATVIPDAVEKSLERASQAVSQQASADGTVLQHNCNKDNNPVGSSSLDLKQEWNHLGQGLLMVTQAAGLSERQQAWIEKAARRYGTRKVWWALLRASRRYSVECLDRVVWGMLRQANPEAA